MAVRKYIRQFLKEESATTAVEYAVMLALILIAIIAGISSVGGGTNGWWNKTNTEFSTYGF